MQNNVRNAHIKIPMSISNGNNATNEKRHAKEIREKNSHVK